MLKLQNKDHHVQHESESTTSEEDIGNEKPALFASFFHNVAKKKITRAPVENETDEYFKEAVLKYKDPLSYWRAKANSSSLKRLARDMLGITATSAPSERIFSIAGNFYRPERFQLGAKTFRMLLLIKCNKAIL